MSYKYRVKGQRYLRKYTAEHRTPVYSAALDASLAAKSMCNVAWESVTPSKAKMPSHTDKDNTNVDNRDEFDAALFCADHVENEHRAYANAAAYVFKLDKVARKTLKSITVNVSSDPYNSNGARVAIHTIDSLEAFPKDCGTCRGENEDGSLKPWAAGRIAVRTSKMSGGKEYWYPATETCKISPADALTLGEYLIVFVTMENYNVTRGNWLEGSSYIDNLVEIELDEQIEGWDEANIYDLSGVERKEYVVCQDGVSSNDGAKTCVKSITLQGSGRKIEPFIDEDDAQEVESQVYSCTLEKEKDSDGKPSKVVVIEHLRGVLDGPISYVSCFDLLSYNIGIFVAIGDFSQTSIEGYPGIAVWTSLLSDVSSYGGSILNINVPHYIVDKMLSLKKEGRKIVSACVAPVETFESFTDNFFALYLCYDSGAFVENIDGVPKIVPIGTFKFESSAFYPIISSNNSGVMPQDEEAVYFHRDCYYPYMLSSCKWGSNGKATQVELAAVTFEPSQIQGKDYLKCVASASCIKPIGAINATSNCNWNLFNFFVAGNITSISSYISDAGPFFMVSGRFDFAWDSQMSMRPIKNLIGMRINLEKAMSDTALGKDIPYVNWISGVEFSSYEGFEIVPYSGTAYENDYVAFGAFDVANNVASLEDFGINRDAVGYRVHSGRKICLMGKKSTHSANSFAYFSSSIIQYKTKVVFFSKGKGVSTLDSIIIVTRRKELRSRVKYDSVVPSNNISNTGRAIVSSLYGRFNKSEYDENSFLLEDKNNVSVGFCISQPTLKVDAWKESKSVYTVEVQPWRLTAASSIIPFVLPEGKWFNAIKISKRDYSSTGGRINVWLKRDEYLTEIPDISDASYYLGDKNNVGGWELIAQLSHHSDEDDIIKIPTLKGRVATLLLTAYMPIEDVVIPTEYIEGEEVAVAPQGTDTNLDCNDVVSERLEPTISGAWKPTITLIG